MINSKKKGNRCELEIVHILNEFYNTNVFERSPSSGARATSSHNLTKSKANILIGDIIVPDWFPHFIEIKGYKSIDIWKIFETGLFPKEWEEERKRQLEQLKVSDKKGILLIFKENNKDWLAMIEKDKEDHKDINFIYLNNGRMIYQLKDLLKLIKIT